MAECYLCGATSRALVAEIAQKPAAETDFGFSPYRRAVCQCQECTVYYNVHEYTLDDFYSGAYNAATYQSRLKEKYERIRSLPPERSDNKQRVRRIADFFAARGQAYGKVRVLDVGSGLSVFGGEMADAGFPCWVIDPDPLAVRHALEYVGLRGGHAGTLEDFQTTRRFALITFNKVLEHVPGPVAMLRRALDFLEEGGVVYIELPDGERARQNGGVVDREEFYIDHYTIFTRAALRYMMQAAGLVELEAAALHEPSDKYTLYGFYAVARA